MRGVFLLFLWMPAIAFAQSPVESAVQKLLAAQALLAAPSEAVDPVQSATAVVLAYQDAMFAVRDADRDLALAAKDLQAALAVQEAELAKLLSALTGISRTTGPVARVHPEGALGALRAGMIVSELAPSVAAERAALAAQVQKLSDMRQEQTALAEQLRLSLEGAELARRRLVDANAQADRPQAFQASSVETALLVANAGSLQAFADQVAQTRPDPDQNDLPRGELPPPVAGPVLPDDGRGRPGVRIGAAAYALVTTPVATTILYQGPFRGYGTVVILEPQPDVIFVLAGLGEVLVRTGDVVIAGSPIGLMPARDDGYLTENVTALAGPRATALYLEVREGQTPSDPRGWFALND